LNLKIEDSVATVASVNAELAKDFDKLETKIGKSSKREEPRPTSSLPGLPETAKNLSVPAQNRLLQARLRVLDAELEKQLEKNAKLNAQTAGQQDRLKELELYRSSTEKKLANLQQSQQKLTQQLDESKKQTIRMTNEKTNAEKELAKLMREDRTRGSKIAQQEARLNRAVEDMEKYKSELIRVKKEKRDDVGRDNARSEDLVQENRRLVRLVEDLKLCTKKQFKLIDVLKQQKMHLEAARNLQFTEQDWQKVLDSSVDESKTFF